MLKNRLTQLACLLTLLFINSNLKAQAPSFDPDFNNTNLKYGNGIGPDAEVRAILPLPDGRFVIGGWFAYYNGKEVQRIAIIKPDGEYDNTFNAGRGFNGVVQCLARQSDGSILAGGDFTQFNNQPAQRLVRLNGNGQRDNTFIASFNGIVRGLAVQPDGKILVAGWFTQVNGQPINYLARLKSNGEVDSSFTTNIIDNYINAMQLMANGNIYIGGGFDTIAGARYAHLARLNNNGQPDTLFNTSNASNGDVINLLVQADGKILIGGWFNFYAQQQRSKIARVNFDGSLDETFVVGSGASNDVTSFALQPDGKILIGGFFNNYNGAARDNIARLNTNGSIDNSFNIGAGFTSGILNYVVRVSAFAVNSFGQIYVGGDFIKYNGFNKSCLLRLNANGSFDGEFNPYNATDGNVHKIVAVNGGYIIGGNFSAYNNRYQKGNMLKLFENGLPDDNFSPIFNGVVNDFVVEPNGYLTAVGNFTAVNNANAAGMVRVTPNGAYDSSFAGWLGFNANATINCIKLVNGKYLVGGSFSSYKGIPVSNIVLIDYNGNLDATFTVSLNNAVHAILVQPDGKIVIGGSFSGGIIRLNNNFTIDNSFNIGSGFNNAVYALGLDTANNLLTGGIFTSYNGIFCGRAARLLTTGVYDTLFNIGTGANNAVLSIASQTDGKILLAGAFTQVNGIFANRIIRLQNDGTYDFLFMSGGGANAPIRQVMFEPTGKVMAAGNFSYLAGQYIGGIGRMINDRIITTGNFSGSICAGSKIMVSYQASGAYFSQNKFVAQLSDANGNFNNPINLGEGVTTGNASLMADIPQSMPAGSNYRIRVISTAPAIVGSNNGNPLTFDFCPSIAITNTINTTYCQGQSLLVSFQALGTYNVNNVFKVQLSDSTGNFSNPTDLGAFSGGTTGNIQTNIPLTVAAGRAYRIRVASTSPQVNSFNNGFDIVINATPTATLAVVSRNTFCLGDSAEILVNTTGTIVRYDWLYNNNLLNINQSLPNLFTKFAGTYMVRAVDINGCTANSNGVDINTFQNNFAQVAVNRNAACLFGNSFTFTDITDAPNKASRQWQIQQINFSDSIVTRQFLAPGRYTARLIIRYTDGCMDTAAQQITVHPQTNIQISINNPTQCVNNNAFEFIDSSVLQSGFYFRQWDFGNNETYSTPLVNKKYGLIGSYQVKLRTITDFGCVDSGLAMVSINPNPTAKFGYKAIVPCFENNYFQFFDSSVIQNGNIDYVQWLIPSYAPSLAPNPGVSLPSEGLNKITLIAVSKLGCTDTAVKQVNVLPNPAKPYIVYEKGELVSAPGRWYQWLLNGVVVSDSNRQALVPTAAGSYQVRVFNDENCSRLSDPFVITNVGLAQFNGLTEEILLYPNPAKQVIHIKCNLQAKIIITDVAGKQVAVFSCNNGLVEHNISHLAAGMYVVEIETFKNKTARRLIIE